MSEAVDLVSVLERSERLYDEAQIEDAIDFMANEITARLSGKNPVVITVMNGGLFLAAQLSLRLSFAIELDYCHATRYRDNVGHNDLIWKAVPTAGLQDRSVLLIDDILDEGKTLAAIRAYCIASRAAEVQIAVLTQKLHDRCVPDLHADYIGLTVPDKYVFGYGMDFKGSLRNLPGIYALKDEG
jgi:hypoxanthine phosphoribosyltransferase